ncbi:MAG: polysulfide reductase NrfD [Desulfuromonadales bacterium]|nr:polysulfide reductase NrfD [Desulfuromonadales bacterium]
MFDLALTGGRRYWSWVVFLLLLMGVGLFFYLQQLQHGLGITGLSRDVSWGIYIAQFTFFVGVAASAVMVVLPYYLHDVRQFGRITILGELLAIAAVTMCMLFIFVDMGQPTRVLNVLLHPTLHSLMFWDMVSLSGYLLINATVAYVMLNAEYKGVPAPGWIKPVILLSIPWAISIHTVTAFLYNGLPGRHLWFTAILAPRFLASAFAAGPALLILLCLLLRRLTSFDAGREAIGKLGVVVAYAMAANIFFLLLELFTALYSQVPDHIHAFEYLFFGLEGEAGLAPLMWGSVVLGVIALVALLVPRLRRNEKILATAAVLVFVSLWLEKGMGMIVGGFVPSPLGAVTPYAPTLPEWAIVAGIWATGGLLITFFYKIVVAVRAAN